MSGYRNSSTINPTYDCTNMMNTMNNRETKHGLGPRQLADLLSIGLDKNLSGNHVMNSDDEIKRFFQLLLKRKIPMEAGIMDAIMLFLREDKVYSNQIINHSLGELLTNAKTEIGLLKTIKDYSKKIYQSTVSKGENSIAIAIYYAAIAGGLVYHDTKISEHNYNALKSAFSNLMQRPWITAEIKHLFSRAYEICQNEHRTQ